MKVARRRWLSAFAALIIAGGATTIQTARAADPSPTAEEAAAAAASLTTEAYLRDPDAPVAGNADGNLTVVEFFDYQCPYCRAMHADLKRFLAEDPKIRFVFKDWPIFGDASVYAARVALAARCEPRRICRRLPLLRGWSHDEVHSPLLT
jgi:protein-disulfide isomerase